MFDSTPSNLPLEPATGSKPPLQPRPVPRRDDVLTPAPVLGGSSGAKEPEDIFSNVGDRASDVGGSSSMDELPPELQDMPDRHLGKKIAVGFAVFVLLGVIGGGAYYALVLRPAAQEEAKALADANGVTQQPPTTPSIAEPLTPPPSLPDQGVNPIPTTTDTQPTTTNPDAENQNPVTTPPNIPPPTSIEPESPATPTEPSPQTSSVDGDGDELTDAEEAILGSDPTVADTDGDGFSDGAEIKGLYSPLAPSASITALTSIKVVRWANMTFLMPTAWNLVDQTSVTATIQTSTGERFILTLNDAAVPSPVVGTSMTTKNNLSATVGSDGISGDVRLGSTRLVITPADPRTAPAYRTILYLILQSVRLAQ